MNRINIFLSVTDDIKEMMALSRDKRLAYEKVEPLFWRYAENAEFAQTKYFQKSLNDQDYILLVAKQENEIQGFIIGKLITAPAVYNPGGLTLLIDDFCVKNESLWQTIGIALLNEIKYLAKAKGAIQI